MAAPQAPAQAPLGSGPDLENIQGDIIAGLPKKAEVFFFFQITNVDTFRKRLAKLIPQIASTAAVNRARDDIAQHKQWCNHGPLDINFTNIAFSAKGLKKLGINDNIGDEVFNDGQLADADGLGDPGHGQGKDFEPDWLFPFKHDMDGVILVAGASIISVKLQLLQAQAVLAGTVREVYQVVGNTRPGKEDGHEHFGFEDGISQPGVKGLSTNVQPGDDECKQGVILMGRDGDPVASRPSWAVDGSILAFRVLNQLVPEFNRFLADNAIKTNDPTINGADLLGARLVGRWKSGAPIAVTPLRDDPILAANPQKVNDFDFDVASQDKCPFAAHIRKSYPRNDFDEDTVDAPHRILRRGIAFGPEVTPAEIEHKTTMHDRGLLFVSYQSALNQGFQFIQKNWVNNPAFPFGKNVQPGFDPVIGQNHGGQRSIAGTDPGNIGASLNLGMQQFVVPKGGEYFFSPSISALKSTFASAN